MQPEQTSQSHLPQDETYPTHHTLPDNEYFEVSSPFHTPHLLPRLSKLSSHHSAVEFKKKFSFMYDPDNMNHLEPMELYWDHLTIKSVSKVKKNVGGRTMKVKEEKVILNSLKGILSPSTFTVILGPSGSGKTTLLNFLSGRINSNNLEMNGILKMNGLQIESIEKYSNKIAFVQQDDILLGMFTPREALRFSANIRMRASKEKKDEKVNKLLRDLGLEKCADTRVGNELIRGVSGGERKRTSIGVELLTNPSLIFLDEPTTGLDSNTAVTIMYLLRDMADSGRTVVSVIHQPSTGIFKEFDKLILMCKGNIIYQGDAQTAVNYFASIGYECPPLTNPSDFFMKIMNPQQMLIEYLEKGLELNKDNKEELMQKFDEHVSFFTQKYKESHNHENMHLTQTIPVKVDRTANTVSWLTQLLLLFQRELIKTFKNPFDMRV